MFQYPLNWKKLDCKLTESFIATGKRGVDKVVSMLMRFVLWLLQLEEKAKELWLKQEKNS